MPHSASTLGSEHPRGSWLSVLGWAAYLACSWTWCIGMFLPVLLVRDYGIWGFVVFAVPNVVGAGAMGWALANGASQRISTHHRAACAMFSWVTIAFQAYFFCAYLSAEFFDSRLFLPNAASEHTSSEILIAILLPIVASAALCRLRNGGVAAWLLSAAVVALAAGLGGIRPRVIEGAKGPSGLLWLAPVCTFGFLLCPYLDATFLRARANLGKRDAHAAFTLGFGVLFLAAILTTLWYSGVALDTLGGKRIPEWVAVALAGYIVLQLTFTIGVHATAAAAKPQTLAATVISLAVGILAMVVAMRLKDSIFILRLGMDVREVLYRCFMSFYGLVFPAYVWLCMIPTRDGHSGTAGTAGRRKLIVLAGACALAAPCYWMGFIERVEWWLAPGLGIVLLARLLVRPLPRPGGGGDSSEARIGGGAHVSGL